MSFDKDGNSDWVGRRWSSVARQHGRLAHPLMEVNAISAYHPYLRMPPSELTYHPRPGPSAEAFNLVERQLQRFTASPDEMLYAVWEGHSTVLEDAASISNSGLLDLGDRRYLIYSGDQRSPADFVDESEASLPDFWWPQDRAWVVCTDIDLDWAYIAASSECMRQILLQESAEIFLTSWDSPDHGQMDSLNHESSVTKWLAAPKETVDLKCPFET